MTFAAGLIAMLLIVQGILGLVTPIRGELPLLHARIPKHPCSRRRFGRRCLCAHLLSQWRDPSRGYPQM